MASLAAEGGAGGGGEEVQKILALWSRALGVKALLASCPRNTPVQPKLVTC